MMQKRVFPPVNPCSRHGFYPKPKYKPPNFIVQLRSSHRTLNRSQLDALIAKLPFSPQSSFIISSTGSAVGSLFYEQWHQTRDVMVSLWKLRLKGEIFYYPFLKENVVVPSDRQELNDLLKIIFVKELNGSLDGVLVNKWQNKLGDLMREIDQVWRNLRRHNKIGVYDDLSRKKKGLEAERDLIASRIHEFKNGIKCIIDYLGGNKVEGDLSVISFDENKHDFDWNKIHCLMVRECKRLDDGLPIFAYRQQILKQIHYQQVTVLVGETGSGKSTQVVQFLADSGITGDGSVICTQPRKLAANTLAKRVKEESQGCYSDDSIICNPSYWSCQEYDSKVVFMTDHCLLQHYMGNNTLSGISCIVVDEAHERSLNTDLLLALIKNLLRQRIDLRLIIMSATIDAEQLADYYFGCGTFHVVGRAFPVDIEYVPCDPDGRPGFSGVIAPYLNDVIKMVTEIHRTEEDGTILAFLTSQSEVEWACEKFQAPMAIAFPLHGKLSCEEQNKVFLTYSGRRKVIFSTNLAETSLTIPGVKYVVDSGYVKENRFEPSTGMSVLRVCSVSQSSANQRAGRAGRTEPGKCYRLYSQNDFEGMPHHQDPEIRRVHLGVAVLRILALGIKNVQDFDFVDAPSPNAIEMATKNLVQIGAVRKQGDTYELTADGWKIVKLGIEPRLGKLILSCFDHLMGREGVVLAAVMANSGSIFCRVGSEGDKLRSDRRKVQFCHPSGDLFTLLSVYKEWEAVPSEKKNIWCWDNQINAKTMRRCHETVQELEACLENELHMIVSTYWRLDPQVHTKHDEILQSIILSSLAENVAMYSGYDQLGYEVALTGKCVQLHPSCSLLNFDQRPRWVVFGEVLAAANEYLVCVTEFEFTTLSNLEPAPLFDFLKMEARKLEKKILTGFGTMLLKRFCGRSNNSVNNLVSRVRTCHNDERIGIQVNVEENTISLYTSSRDVEGVARQVSGTLEFERKLLRNECLEKCLFSGGSAAVSVSVALFGAGAVIKHLELEKRCLAVDVFLRSNGNGNQNAIVDDKELLMYLERATCGNICNVFKYFGDIKDNKWGLVKFLTPDAAERATKLFLNEVEYSGGFLRAAPSKNLNSSDQKMFRSAAIRAKVSWPRKCSKGVGFVKCDPMDVAFLVNDFSDLMIGEKMIRCEASNKYEDSIVISGLDWNASEMEILDVLRSATNRRFFDFFLVRRDAAEGPTVATCEEALHRELSSFMPKQGFPYVKVYEPEIKDAYMRAAITFDGSLHLEAAKALEQIDGKVLAGCLPWQKIRCQQLFHSSVSCPSPAYHVIRNQLNSLLASLRQRKGVECKLDRNDNGSYIVKITADATRVVAELRRPLEQLMKGKVVDISPGVVQLLFTREGINIMRSVGQETGTYLLFDKHNLLVRIFGSSDDIGMAQPRFIDSLLALNESKQLEVRLRGGLFPPDLMKRVVQTFGPDLGGLKERVPGAEFSLNTKRHSICINGGTKDVKHKVEEILCEISQSGVPIERTGDISVSDCPICLCEREDPYRLESCLHMFCRSCLLEQCESAIKSREGFPLCCMYQGCGEHILLADLRSLLSSDKLEDLFRASLGAYVAASGGTYRFCPSPDCPSVYRVTDTDEEGAPFSCGACFVETCTRCHVEYHPYLSCEKYQEFKSDPDLSLEEWSKGKDNVKKCPVCSFTIEKVEGCNHIECKCGSHVCWVCLEFFDNSTDCYGHLRSVHMAII